MIPNRSASCALAFIALAWTDISAQTAIPELRLPLSPLLEIGKTNVELHGVRTASIRANGDLVIADAGNHRVLVVSPRGQVVRQLGRRGSGPGEFEDISQLWIAGDTIITSDPVLMRITVWHPDGTPIKATMLPHFKERPIFPLSALSAWRYVGRTPAGAIGDSRAGLYRDSSNILLTDGRTDSVQPIGKLDWSYSYLYVAARGPIQTTSTYRTPFLGETVVTSARGYIAVVPRSTARVELWLADGSRHGRVEIPVSQRLLTRDIIDAYRDSIIDASRPSAARFPGSIARLEETFGPRFLMPSGEYAPVIQRVVAVGGTVWLQALATGRSSTTDWYIVDVQDPRLIGRIVLPDDWIVLGGNNKKVIILRRDELDAQYLQVYDLSGWGSAAGI